MKLAPDLLTYLLTVVHRLNSQWRLPSSSGHPSCHIVYYKDVDRGYEFVNEFACVLIDFSLTVKAATLIFISGRGSTISSAKEGTSGFINNLVKS